MRLRMCPSRVATGKARCVACIWQGVATVAMRAPARVARRSGRIRAPELAAAAVARPPEALHPFRNAGAGRCSNGPVAASDAVAVERTRRAGRLGDEPFRQDLRDCSTSDTNAASSTISAVTATPDSDNVGTTRMSPAASAGTTVTVSSPSAAQL